MLCHQCEKEIHGNDFIRSSPVLFTHKSCYIELFLRDNLLNIHEGATERNWAPGQYYRYRMAANGRDGYKFQALRFKSADKTVCHDGTLEPSLELVQVGGGAVSVLRKYDCLECADLEWEALCHTGKSQTIASAFLLAHRQNCAKQPRLWSIPPAGIPNFARADIGGKLLEAVG